MTTIDRPAILAGAVAAVAIDLPVSIIAQVVEGDDGKASNLSFLFFAAVLAGFAVGGFVAARRAPEVPFTNGALAALLAFAMIQVIALLSRTVRDEPLASPASVVFLGLLAYATGLLGATLAVRSARATSP